MRALSFPKSNRLSKKRTLQELFDRGSSFYTYPFKVVFNLGTDSSSHQVMVSVSKRNFRNATDRNLVKRRVKEAFRLTQHLLPNDKKFQIVYIYTANEILDFEKIQEKVVKSYKKLENEKEN
jgi:ribonuclease P protein component